MLPNEKTIGLRIRRIRQVMNETQQQLGEAVGVIQQSVAAWESGRSLPNVQSLIRIAEHYQISTDRILGLSVGCEQTPGIID
jgi:transcriptional regulator with XRE-family HTH domain